MTSTVPNMLSLMLDRWFSAYGSLSIRMRDALVISPEKLARCPGLTMGVSTPDSPAGLGLHRTTLFYNYARAN